VGEETTDWEYWIMNSRDGMREPTFELGSAAPRFHWRTTESQDQSVLHLVKDQSGRGDCTGVVSQTAVLGSAPPYWWWDVLLATAIPISRTNRYRGQLPELDGAGSSPVSRSSLLSDQ
jgi:hypothetical protein